ncbi:MAG TPA: hypothetical protein VKZ78_05870 [Sphingobacteriaceae bacterium]|nr:hypothetical protein [Sphingobacteriaceae bacterium]
MKNLKSLWCLSSTLMVLLLITAACGGNKENAEITKLKEETIAVHDEIMPQISLFDRQTVRIDSFLVSMDSLKATNDALDTAQLRVDLTQVKNRLGEATDQMMQWMKEFDVNPQDKSEEEIKSYYQSELEKIKKMKNLFDEVSKESAEKLSDL